MASFTANKSAGGGGKIAMHTDELITAMTVISTDDDIFLISRLSKLIRFMAAEVPVKDAPVQGVNCMLLRADEVVAGAKA
jgi:DNA gyrase/topoisomerase IV subunit A